jgi:hypothetical protein
MNKKQHYVTHTQKMCEGLDCYLHATNVSRQNAGNIGQITLFLCDDCFAKFSDCNYSRQEIEMSDREGPWQVLEVTGEYHNSIRRKTK